MAWPDTATVPSARDATVEHRTKTSRPEDVTRDCSTSTRASTLSPTSTGRSNLPGKQAWHTRMCGQTVCCIRAVDVGLLIATRSVGCSVVKRHFRHWDCSFEEAAALGLVFFIVCVWIPNLSGICVPCAQLVLYLVCEHERGRSGGAYIGCMCDEINNKSTSKCVTLQRDTAVLMNHKVNFSPERSPTK